MTCIYVTLAKSVTGNYVVLPNSGRVSLQYSAFTIALDTQQSEEVDKAIEQQASACKAIAAEMADSGDNFNERYFYVMLMEGFVPMIHLRINMCPTAGVTHRKVELVLPMHNGHKTLKLGTLGGFLSNSPLSSVSEISDRVWPEMARDPLPWED